MTTHIFPKASAKSFAKKPRVYLAGKIAEHGWREKLTDGPIDVNDPLNVHEAVEYRDFVVTGPFFQPGGHGCAHVPQTHGQGDVEVRGKVFATDVAKIQQSDFMFAYVNELNCHGTKVEIGVAYANAVPVFLCFGPEMTRADINDFWFVAEACTVVPGELEVAFAVALTVWRETHKRSFVGLRRT